MWAVLGPSGMVCYSSLGEASGNMQIEGIFLLGRYVEDTISA
jgi:hypothetical protein